MSTCINLGSGWRPLAGFTNVDLHHAADVRADLRDYDREPGTADRVVCIHAIEHIEWNDAVSLIARAARWLRQGGTLEIETPDRLKCLALIDTGKHLEGAKGLFGGRSIDKPDWHQWLTNWARGDRASTEIPHRWDLPGERHCFVWTAAELCGVMRGAGLDARSECPQHHGARVNRDCRVVGVKL